MHGGHAAEIAHEDSLFTGDEKGAFTKDSDGNVQLSMTVYAYDSFDMVDISTMPMIRQLQKQRTRQMIL